MDLTDIDVAGYIPDSQVLSSLKLSIDNIYDIKM